MTDALLALTALSLDSLSTTTAFTLLLPGVDLVFLLTVDQPSSSS